MTDVAAYKRAVMALVGERDRAPRNAEIALALSEALLRLAKRTPGVTERMKLLERAVKVDPYDARTRTQLGLARGRLGDARGALSAMRAASVLEPDAPDAALALALASLVELRERPNKDVADKAIEAFDKVLATKPAPTLARVAHAGKLVAAVHAPVVGPKPNRLGKLLPATLDAIEPKRDWAAFMGYLGAAMAFTAYFRKLQLKAPKPDELTARKKMLDAIAGGLATWRSAFPDVRQLAVAETMLAILRSDEAGLAATIVASSAKLPPRLLHLVARQRLEELEVTRRVEILQAVDKLAPLSHGLDRELVLALNATARGAICRGDAPGAAELWKQGITHDPYNPGLHHNLALLALSRRDASSFSAHLDTTVDLLLSYWLLRDGNTAGLATLAAKHESFAQRLRKTIDTSLVAENGQVAPGVVGAWCGETLASIVVGRVARTYSRKLPPNEVLEQLVPYLRRLPAVFEEPVELPPVLAKLVDPPLTGEPPLHYDALGVPPNAPPSAIHRRYAEAMEELTREKMEALLKGERDLARDLERKIARLEEAFAELSDIAKRKRYDVRCIPAEEHQYNLSRRRFIQDLYEFSDRLTDRKLTDSIPLLLNAYLQIPHDNIDPYFEAIAPGRRLAYRTRMLEFRYSQLIAQSEEFMNKQEWARALELLRVIVAAGGSSLRSVQYLTAVCEFKVEGEFARKNGRFSGPSTPMPKDVARARFNALPSEERQDEVMRLLQQFMRPPRTGEDEEERA